MAQPNGSNVVATRIPPVSFEGNEQIKQGVLEGVEAIKSDAAAGYEVMQVFATSVAQRVPDVTIEEYIVW